jgi:DNA-binding LacI/PurR family transcriptional regulator
MPLSVMNDRREWMKVSTAGQLAVHLRGELARGRWHGTMPGVIRLASELGVGRDAVEEALHELEREGVLRAQGKGKRRLVVSGGEWAGGRVLRVAILLGEPGDKLIGFFMEMVHALRRAGQEAEFAPKTQIELGDSAARVARMVEATEADAWVVFSGSLEVLEWFAASGRPVIAIAGRANRVQITSIAPDKLPPLRTAIRRLVELGHRRIVLMCRPHRLLPEPGMSERAFLEELEAQGIATGPYHLQTWDETADGYHKALEKLFRFSPPTALFVEEAPFVAATFQFCMKHSLKVPEDLSLICFDPVEAFEWCRPEITHIAWDQRQLVRRIVRWAGNVRDGKDDRKKGFLKARLIEGGTMGPASRKKA